jgi:hypothetical protein
MDAPTGPTAPPNPLTDAAGDFVFPSLIQVFCLPGDWLMYGFARYAPDVAAALELGPSEYGGASSAFLSLLGWAMIGIVAIIVWGFLRAVDRNVTRIVGGLYGHVRWRIRMATALARYKREQSTRRVEPSLQTTEPEPDGPLLRQRSSRHA